MREIWMAAAALVLLLAVLAAVWHDLIWHTVRIYNWDGKKYRFLGRGRLRRLYGAHAVTLREQMGDMSFTTRYLLFVSAEFAKRYRYENLLLRAGAAQVWLPVEERMQADVLYAHVLYQ